MPSSSTMKNASLSPSKAGGSTGNTTPTSVITQMEETLARLDGYVLPEEFTTHHHRNHNKENSNSNDNNITKKKSVSSLIQRYEGLRKGYLDCQVETSVVDHVQAHDLEHLHEALPPHIAQHNENEQDELDQKQENMIQALQDTAQRMVTAEQELQTEYDLLQQRKAELRTLLQDYAQTGSRLDWSFSSLNENPHDDDDDQEEDGGKTADEKIQQDLAEQEQILTELQTRKRTLQGQLEKLQVEALEAEEENDRLEASVHVQDGNDTELLQKETQQLQQQAQTLQRIKQDYDCRRELLEELSGLKMESIEQDNSNGNNNHLIHITILMLRSHKLRVTLESPPQGRGRIVAAKIVDNHQPKGLFLPPLEDLLPTVQDPAGLAVHAMVSHETAAFRFLLHQALARLETFQDRQQEVELLRQICTSVQLPVNGSDPEQHLFQPVICVWDWKTAAPQQQQDTTQVKAVLRLTPDCPALGGSVFLEDLSCVPETNNKNLWAAFVSRVQSRQHDYSSPTQLVTYLQQALVSEQWKQRPLEPTKLLQNHYNSSPQKSNNHDDDASMNDNGGVENGTDGLWEC